MPGSKRYTGKLCLIKCQLDTINIDIWQFIILNTGLFFNCGFSINVTCWKTEITLFNPFYYKQKTNILHIFNRLRFQGYRWQSGIAIFAWSVTWNCTYSLIKGGSHTLHTKHYSLIKGFFSYCFHAGLFSRFKNNNFNFVMFKTNKFITFIVLKKIYIRAQGALCKQLAQS